MIGKTMEPLKKIDRQNIEDIFALTPMQEGMLFHYLRDPQSQHYFEQLNLGITGEIDIEVFKKAWNLVIETNDMLRTVIRWEKMEEPVQVILKEHKLQLEYYEFSIRDAGEKKNQLEVITVNDRKKNFDFRKVPFRMTLCKIEEDKYEMIISNHHILYDGWSNGIILKEFFSSYNDLVHGKKLAIPVKTKFKEFVKLLRVQDLNRQEKYWKDYLKGFDTQTGLPVKKRKEKERTNTKNYQINLTADEKKELERFVKGYKVTLAALLYTAWGILLQKYNNTDDVIFGITVSGRSVGVDGIEDMVGLFINTLPLRIKTNSNEKTRELLYRIDNALQMMKEFEVTSPVDIKKYSEIDSKEELFDSIVVIENYPLDTRLIPGNENLSLSVDSYSMVEMTHYNLTIAISIFHDMEVTFSYNEGWFDEEAIVRLSHHFRGIVKDIMTDPGKEIAGIEIISEEEKDKILFEFNNPGTGYPEDKTVHQLFAGQVERTPDHIALLGQCAVRKAQGEKEKSCAITYRELNNESDQLAYWLKEKGVGPDIIVGIMVERSIEIIVGIIAILKAGGAYLPIDPKYPEERKRYMLADSNAKVLISTSTLAKEVKKLRSLEVKKNLEIIFLDSIEFSVFSSSHLLNFSTSHSTNLAYVIYTSGSTGKPKGVMVEHRNLTAYIHAFYREFAITSNDTALQQASFAFDAFVEEVYPVLLRGGRIALPSADEILDIHLLREFIVKNRVTLTSCSPLLLKELNRCNRKELDTIHTFISGGDVLRGEYVDRLVRIGTVYNTYGPTETTVCVTYYKCLKNDVSTIPIGKPIANYKVYILDKDNRLQPIGVGGELYISGDGVTRGYLNRPELTAERFYRSYKSYMSYIFRTGDLAKWLPDGNIEFLGRIDRQVKIRGFRIELGEIESRLVEHERIRDAVVVDSEDDDGEKYLCAYVVYKDNEYGTTLDRATGISELRDYLLSVLPGYMIPAYFVPIDGIPLTSSGKIDRKALPASKFVRTREYSAPGNIIEKKLIDIWSEVLGEDLSIGIEDNFFELGGHSLKAITMVSKIYKEMEVKVPLVEVFKRHTLRQLAEYINEAEENKYAGIEPVEKKEYYPLSSAQKRMYFIQQMDMKSTAYNMPLVLPRGKDMERDKLESLLKKLIARHESLRTAFIMVKNEPVQKIHDELNFETEYFGAHELHELHEKKNNKKFLWMFHGPGGGFSKEPPGRRRHEDIIKNFIRPFDLSQAPLMRSGLTGLPHGNHTWMVDIHHIVSDGTSHTVLLEDFMTLCKGEGLEPLRLQYRDFSQWQNRLFESGKIKNQEDYWLELYTGEIPRLHMLADYNRPEVFTFAGAHHYFILPGEDGVKFKALASRNGATLFMNILAALNTLFYKYTGQVDIIIGTGIAGRPHVDLQDIIGMFVNTLAMRNYPEGEKTYKAFLKEVMARSIEAFENQDVQFEDLVDKLGLERDPSRNPLFDISMVVQNFRQAAAPAPADNLPQIHYKNTTSKFDITFFIYESGEKVYFDIEYYTGVFKQETIRRMALHFNNIVKTVTREPTIKLKEIDIISQEEKIQVLYEFNDTAKAYPKDKTIHQLFEEQVVRTPDHIALIGVGTRFIASDLRKHTIHVTYRELNQQSNQLAHYLYYEKHIRLEEPVGILMSQPIDLAVGILGILKVGAAYVPLDPFLPEKRLKYMINDAGIGTVISEKKHIKMLNRLQWECEGFHSYLGVDSFHIHQEDEREFNELMDEELWHHVGETAADDITGGGWVSSYTGKPFSRAEMDEYGDNIVKKLEFLLYPNLRVLEIGCASGITMYRIAPKVGLYYGTDLSKVIIRKNKKRVKAGNHQNIKLSCLAAHEIDKLNENETYFDLIVINSVIQCFHGHNYLGKVIKMSIDLLGETGYLFIGDIMDQEKKDALVRELSAFKNSNKDKKYTTKTDFSSELFVSRGFWKDLAAEFPGIEEIESSDKIYTIENELTKYRYDVLITINKSDRASSGKRRQRRKYQDDLNILSSCGSDALHLNIPPGNLAYIIYTSGTTGEPKGVEVQHRGVVNTLWYRKEEYRMNPGFVALQLFSPGFDGYVTGFFTPIISGAKLVLLNKKDIGDIEKARNAVVKNNVTHFICVPPLFSALVEAFTREDFSTLKVVTLAGDKLSLDMVKRSISKCPDLEIVNEYGVTESSVMSTIYRHQEQDSRIKIGGPIWNTRLYILDGDQRLQPVGAAGELCIAGVGLARGYLNNPELTAKRFCLRRPGGALFGKNRPREASGLPPQKLLINRSYMSYRSYIYRTGDLARWLSEGNIEFLGRIDQQVKIRGFRIELGEIENRLLQHDAIKEAIVTASQQADGDKYLCAYIVANTAVFEKEKNALREFLAQTLPDYMIPSYFIHIDRIPLNPGGKVDKKKLPAPGFGLTDKGIVPPGNETEEKLVETWLEVLGVPRLGITDNFFEVGGDSIKAIQVSARLKRYGLDLKINDLFLHPVIKELEKYVTKTQRVFPQGIVEGEVELTPIQQWFFQSDFSAKHHFNQSVMLYRARGFDEIMLKKVMTRLVEHHDALRMVYQFENQEKPLVVQRNRGIDAKADQELFNLEVFNFKEVEAIDIETRVQQESHRIQGSIDLERGPLVKSGLFRTPGGDHLLIVIHHLVVDGVSWRILLEDFAAGYRQLERGESIKFPEKTDSFQYWARELKEYAAGHTKAPNKGVLKELDYWKALDAVHLHPLPQDPVDLYTKKETNKTIYITLDKKNTGHLLRKVNWAYNTEINDILLTALGMAVKEWAGTEMVGIDLEGHGREPISKDVDVSRTVGWFTAQYPVILDMTGPGNLSYMIKHIKETLRSIPNKGIGYGILRYLTPAEKKNGYRFRLNPRISFNYLGQFGQDMGDKGKTGEFIKISRISSGQSISPEPENSYAVEVNGMLVDGRLNLSFAGNKYELQTHRLQQLAESYKSNLLRIIDYCAARERKEPTPSDLGYNKISIEDLLTITQHVASTLGKNAELRYIYPLSPMQSGMLYHALKSDTVNPYFEQFHLTIKGEIHEKLLEDTFNRLVERYDILRTNFVYEKLEEPLQIVLKSRNARIYFEDITHISHETKVIYLEEFMRKERERGFDLARDMLMKFSLFKTGRKSYILVWSFHHILMDGWCLGIIYRDLIRIYRYLKLKSMEPGTGELELGAVTPYRDYIQWLQEQDNDAGLQFWREYLQDCEEPAGLPKSSQWGRGGRYEYEVEEHCFIIDEKQTSQLNRVAAESQVTLNTVIQTAWALLLQKYNNTNDVVFGVVVSGRPPGINGIENMVGMFVNTIPIRVRIQDPGGQKFSRLLRTVREDSAPLKSYEYLPLAEIQSNSSLKGDLINHIMVFENYPIQDQLRDIDDSVLQEVGFHIENDVLYEHTNYDFNIIIAARKCLDFRFSYNARVYESGIVKRVEQHLNRIFKQVISSPGVTVNEIEIITNEEKRQILEGFNDTAADYPEGETIHHWFDKQAQRTPDSIAVIGKAHSVEERHALCALRNTLTYRELNKKSLQLARLLRAKGVRPDTIVGLMTDPSLETIIGILAVLKAGAAYLPIDMKLPGKRGKIIRRESSIRLILTNQPLQNLSHLVKENIEIMDLRDERLYFEDRNSIENINKESDLVYVIYTSGSTGIPKGVMLEHRNLVNLMKFHHSCTNMDCTRVTQFASIGFDASFHEIFSTLLAGGILYVPDKQIRTDIPQLCRFIRENDIKTVFLPISFIKMIFSDDNYASQFPGSIRHIQTAGEQVVIIDRFRQYLEENNVYLHNHYGPSETHVVTTLTLDPASDIPNLPAIGKPISNTEIYIVDKWNYLVPIAVTGELCIGGIQPGRGYLNNPELTADRFYRSYKSYMSYIYRTGDLARWLPDGNIEFLGRIDHQVKIRGFRVELGEIENQLLKHPLIKEAVVLAGIEQTGDKYLCAYIVSNSEMPPPQWREYLAGYLPDYMIPAYFVMLENIPLTPSGKIDRKALPEPDLGPGETYIAPGNAVEEKLAELWAGVLRIPKDLIGIDSNFFQLGGHSLKATVMTSRIHKEFQVKIPLTELFKRQTLRQLAGYIETAEQGVYVGIKPAEKKEFYPLSSAQGRFYVLQQVTPGSTAYNMASIHLLAGHVEKEKFENTLEKLIKRHESLRTSFEIVNGEPVQKVHQSVDFEIEYYDLAADEENYNAPVQKKGRGRMTNYKQNTNHKLQITNKKETKGHHSSKNRIIHNSFIVRPFDLSRAPLLRLGLIKLEEEKHILVFDMHHIITDGTSMTIFLMECMTLYAGAEGSDPGLLVLQYKDFARWQNDRSTSGKLKKQKTYWVERFSGEIPVLNMSTDFPRPPEQSFEGDRFNFTLEKALTHDLKRLITGTGATLFMVLLAIYNVILAKYTGQEDFVIGTTIAGRYHPDLQNIIGLLIETLALRNYPGGEQTFNEFLNDVKQATLEAYENQDYPFKELIRIVGAENEISRNPVFDAMLIVQNFENTDFELEGLKFLPYQPSEENQHISKVDFTIEAVEIDEKEEIYFSLEYCTRLYKRETMARFAGHFINIVREVVKNPGIRLSAIRMISREEKRQLLEEFNNISQDYTGTKMAHELFEEQVERTPGNTAAAGPMQIKYRTYTTYMTYISYRELNEKSDRLAHILKEKGVKPDTIVGIMMDRSIEIIVGIIAILKAGGAYLPIDPKYPEERKRYMLADSNAKVLISTSTLAKEVKKLRSLEVKKNLEIIFLDSIEFSVFSSSHLLNFSTSHSTNLAYIIYTSGSTGKPKGVMVEHRNLIAYIRAFNREFIITANDTVLQQASFTFDAFVEEVYPVLLRGGKIAIPCTEDILDIHLLREFIAKNRVTLITCSPLLLNELNRCKSKALETIHTFISGGDVLRGEYMDGLLRIGTVYNTYGPTETTVCVTYYKCLKDSVSAIPIGKPISNYKVCILSKDNQLQPIGVSGELCVSGDGVTRGYLNNPELTAKRFYRSYKPYMSYIFRTGDLARWLPDGNIEFLGRIDRQVKIRGFRIELGEIETQLLKHDEIKEAVVVVKADQERDKYLCAYIAARDDTSVPGLREYLSQYLPAYMVPTYFILLEQVPLTPNGKPDRKALPEPGIKIGEVSTFITPRNKIEEKLAEIWSEVLGIEKNTIGIDANFFELGGHSLKAMALTAGIHKELKVKISLTGIFRSQTIRELSKHIKGAEQDKYAVICPVEKKEFYLLSSAQKRLYFMQQMDLESTAYNIPQISIFEDDMDKVKLEAFFKKLIARHESLRTCFPTAAETPVQRVHGETVIGHWSLVIGEAGVSEIKDIIMNFIKPFDLSQAPLLRVGLIKLLHTPTALRGHPRRGTYNSQEGKKDRYLLMVDMHHIITDDISHRILIRDFISLYQGSQLPGLKLQYKDYSEWQQSQAVKETCKLQEKYWLNQFKGEIPVLNLPTDYPGPAVLTPGASKIDFEIGKDKTGKLRAFSKNENTTLFMLLLAIFNVLLSKLSGQEDIIVGTAVSGRNPGLNDIIGMFVNVLALRNYPEREQTFAEFLGNVKERTISAFENQDYPYEDLVAKLVVNRDPGRFPLCGVGFNLREIEAAGNKPGEPTPYEYENITAKAEINLFAIETQDKLLMKIEYAAKLFKKQTIEKFIKHFKEIISPVIENREIKLKDIKISHDFFDQKINIPKTGFGF